jgi:methylglyoxal synthase
MDRVIALVAHDARKDDMVRLIRAYSRQLAGIELIATRSTGQLTQSGTGLPVRLLKEGPLGGDWQVGAAVADGSVDAVIFLRDPFTSYAHEPDVSALLRVCDVHNIPIATNLATAEAVLKAVLDESEPSEGYRGRMSSRQTALVEG